MYFEIFNRLLELLQPSIIFDAINSNESSGINITIQHNYPDLILAMGRLLACQGWKPH
jgi:hypothetical protein